MSQAGSGRLAGKVAIVTGAARGMGAAEARLFAAEGAKVVLGDLLEHGRDVADEIGKAATFLRVDIRREEDWTAAITAAEALGPLNVLVNNAAVIHFASIAGTTLADWERVIAVNRTGTFLGMRAAIERLPSGCRLPASGPLVSATVCRAPRAIRHPRGLPTGLRGFPS